jgi:hypothetical protein
MLPVCYIGLSRPQVGNAEKINNRFDMSPPAPFKRSIQATRALLNKKRLLPLTSENADTLALQAHLSLAALRDGVGDIAPAHALNEIILLASFLAEAGHGELGRETLLAGGRAMSEIYKEGRDRGRWIVTSHAFELLSRIVCLYDRQVHSATLGALESASERLARSKAEERQRLRQAPSA